ncbi:hypothetical protein QEV83_03580 [Methylocapsa sp. D3K7]|uniref:hypothetical protein n=1 Tax=Methylocapsa sp. D3K7 TaxID=3041435 RepID=UPI00244EB5BF|nr:hypothetical protein [Methylocapsa sp. D3K7]WGJ15376.1 hypothetical protein QEV83_03580 [Methylocapsa sp. D3K7]
MALDVGLEAREDKGFVISRRKTSRAVIARTMIDGTTHMTQSSYSKLAPVKRSSLPSGFAQPVQLDSN